MANSCIAQCVIVVRSYNERVFELVVGFKCTFGIFWHHLWRYLDSLWFIQNRQWFNLIWLVQKRTKTLIISGKIFLGTRIVAPRPRNNHRIPVLSSCPMPKLKHGTVRMQRAGRMAYFFCSRGYEIHGPMNIVCQNGRWKQEIPICISNSMIQKVFKSWQIIQRNRFRAWLWSSSESVEWIRYDWWKEGNSDALL